MGIVHLLKELGSEVVLDGFRQSHNITVGQHQGSQSRQQGETIWNDSDLSVVLNTQILERVISSSERG